VRRASSHAGAGLGAESDKAHLFWERRRYDATLRTVKPRVTDRGAELATSIAHEINQPLAAIVTNGETTSAARYRALFAIIVTNTVEVTAPSTGQRIAGGN